MDMSICYFCKHEFKDGEEIEVMQILNTCDKCEGVETTEYDCRDCYDCQNIPEEYTDIAICKDCWKTL